MQFLELMYYAFGAQDGHNIGLDYTSGQVF